MSSQPPLFAFLSHLPRCGQTGKVNHLSEELGYKLTSHPVFFKHSLSFPILLQLVANSLSWP
ncbi:hypothetical protein CGRA01v4_07256 [Colletotrichum graminicola]|nr:hypothetical protein CGRA01v4_07256 [Colletotrichum graminicola]